MPGPAGSPFTGGGSGPGMVNIALPGIGSFVGRIKLRGAGLASQVDRLAEHVAGSIRDTAKDLVAKDEHMVEKSIRVEHRESGPTYTVVADRLGERDEVPIYLEIGTYKMAARPFMKPAADLVMAAHGLMRAVVQVGGLLPPMRGQGFGR